MADRELDVTVFGATGFVGRLTAQHLARHAPAGTRIALAGRGEARLRAVRDDLGEAARDWQLVVADSSDSAALRAMARRTTVVATTVGPYARHGMPLVLACAEEGTSYADLTGEVLFVRQSIDAADARARETGARIVHACGFDSVPSDLGVLALADRVAADAEGQLAETTLAVTAARGGFSGGTIASLTGQLDEVRTDKEARRLALDPYALSPDRDAEPDLGPQRELTHPRDDALVGRWVAPFVMASYNTRIVRRSNALMRWRYGKGFRYAEVVATRSGPLGLAAAAAVTAGTGGLAAGLLFAPTRALLARVLPSPGEGPSERAREKGYFRLEVHTCTTSGAHYVAHVGASGDPGHAATSVMLGESVLALAAREGSPEGGVTTPAAALGEPLADRLRARGFTLSVERREG